MNKGIKIVSVRMTLLMKKNLKNPMLYILTAMGLLLSCIFTNCLFPTWENQKFGIVAESGIYSEKIQQDMVASQSDNCIIFQSRDDIEQQVKSGQLSFGFVLTDKVDEVVNTGELAPCVEYISSPSSTGGLQTKEELFAKLLVYMDEQELIRLSEDGETFAESSEDREKMLTETFGKYRNGEDVLQVYFEEVGESVSGEDTSATEDTGIRNDKTAIIYGLLLFIAAIVFAAARFHHEHKSMLAAMRGRERGVWTWLEVLAPVWLMAVFLSVIYMLQKIYAGGWDGRCLIIAVLMSMIYAPVCAGYACLYAKLFRSEGIYLFSIIVVLLLAVITNPVLVPDGMIFAQLKGLRVLFPTYWFMIL